MWPSSFTYLYSWSLAHSQKSCLGEHSGYNDLRCTNGTFISRVHISVSKHWNEFLIALLHESYHFPIWTGLCLTILTKKLQTVLVHLSQSLTILFQAIPSKLIHMILKSTTLQNCKIIYLIFAADPSDRVLSLPLELISNTLNGNGHKLQLTLWSSPGLRILNPDG